MKDEVEDEQKLLKGGRKYIDSKCKSFERMYCVDKVPSYLSFW